MIKRLYSFPISTKLAVSFLVVILVFAIIGAYISAKFTSENINEATDRFVEITVKNSEEFISRRLLEDDKWAVYKFIKSISENEFIKDGVVHNYQKVIAHSNPKEFPIGKYLEDEYIKNGVSFDMYMGDKKLGVVTVFKNSTTINDKVLQSIKRVLAVFILVASGSWLFAIFISKRILKRLTLATKNAELIAKNQWQSLEFKKHHEIDEITILLDSMESMSRDVKAHIDKIENLRNFYHNILSKMDLLILIMDEEHSISYQNGHPLIDEFDIEYLKETIVATRGYDGTSTVIEIKKGNMFFIISSVFIDNAYLISISDITVLKELEKKYSTSKSLALLGEMSSFLSHELKNLLVPLKLLVDAKNLNERDISVMKNAIKNMDIFVGNFLNFAKPPNSEEYDNIELSVLIDEVLFLLSSKLEKKRINLHKELVDMKISIHPKAFEIVALNLLLNSIDACEIEGNIWIRSYREGDFAYFEIEDDGCGIPPEIIDKIFDPFFTTKNSGTGLGLSLVFRIIDDIGAEIDMNSQSGSTRFIVRFVVKNEEKEG